MEIRTTMMVAAAMSVIAGAGLRLAEVDGTYSVRTYGAKGDGVSNETIAINRAIEACAKAGGGQVRFPPGRYLSSTIHLKSRVHLWLEAGAVIVGSPDPESYQSFSPPPEAPESKFGARWHRALIIGDGVQDASIQGPGIIDGNKVFDPRGEERMRGPHTIMLGNCRDIVLRDFTVRDSANYAVMMEGCDDVDVKGLRVTGGWDGIHFRGWPGRPCRRITVSDCRLFTGDDAIAGRYWEDTLIQNCVLNASCNGIRLIGPATRLTIDNCLMYGPGLYEHRSSKRNNMLAGLCLQPGAWDSTTGVMEQVMVSNVTMHNVTTPLFCVVKPGNTARDIRINRLTATGVYLTASSLEGWAEEPITDVALTDFTVSFRPNERTRKASGPVRGPGVDARPLPAWGLYARKVKNLRLANARFLRDGESPGAVMITEQVNGLELDGVRYPEKAGPLVLTGATSVQIRDVFPPPLK